VGTLWGQFQELIFQALLWLEGITHDWGMAIILLTVIIRVALVPLTWHQTKSMVELQRIQPKLKELQAKYKDDQEKLQEETMKFYQENKVNPLGGCLPLLLQMPILIALYQVLGPGKKGGQPGKMLQYLAEHNAVGTFYHIIPDIAKTPQLVWNVQHLPGAIPYLILVLIFAVSIWLPQALMPGERQQKMIGGVMAIVMLGFGWVSPAGVLLYWDVSSIWAIAQQQIMMALNKRDEAAAELPASSKKTPSEAVAGKKDQETATPKAGSKTPAKKTPNKKK
jgi:YidC/Oxa1 family membrane protein insertase